MPGRHWRRQWAQDVDRLVADYAALDGLRRGALMAGHQCNHITIAYVDEDKLGDVFRAFVAQALTQNVRVMVARDASKLL